MIREENRMGKPKVLHHFTVDHFQEVDVGLLGVVFCLTLPLLRQCSGMSP